MLFLFLTLALCSIHSTECDNDVERIKFHLKVKTSNWIFSGTDETIAFRLIGKERNTEWERVDGHSHNGKNPFERNSLDDVYIESLDIGQLLDIEVKVIQVGSYLNKWKLDWVEVTVDETVYKAYFWSVFWSDQAIIAAEEIDIVDCADGFEYVDQPGAKIKQVCRDINECKTRCKGQGKMCENYPGGYNCSCNNGFEMQAGRCADINECARSTDTCSAKPHTSCSNTIGSYECQCRTGYQRVKSLCADIDECESGSSRCQDECANTPGSYQCACRSGYRLAPDGFSCVDANECAENNPCDNKTSECFDTKGGFRCLCKHGYERKPGTNICQPITCGAVLIQPNMEVSPERCLVNGASKKGQTCHFFCKEGFQLHRDSMVDTICSVRAHWVNADRNHSAYEPLCVPKQCKPLNLENGYVLPEACETSGASHTERCQFYCNRGYKLVGRDDVQCFDETFEQSFKLPTCHKEPTIECPRDITINLPEDKDTVQLGEKYRCPTTNMDYDHVTSVPANVSSNYHFSLGTTSVKMVATNDAGQRAECKYTIAVTDNTPPIVKYCPADLHYRVKANQETFVEWPEPIFVDNVAIKQIKQTQKNKGTHLPSTFPVIYDAKDTSGNTATCRFNVYIEVLGCSFDTIQGGDRALIKHCTNLPMQSICVMNCPARKTFHHIPPKKTMMTYWFCKDGAWYNSQADVATQSNPIRRLPDCVDFVQMSNDECPSGFLRTIDYQLFSPVCGKCPRGTRYEMITGRPGGHCISCPEHHYQDEEGQTQCKQCPPGTGGTKTRRTDASSCRVMCDPGKFSRTGFPESRSAGKPKYCHLCPLNTYNPLHGAIDCLPCPPGKLTENEGSTSMSHCIEIPIKVNVRPSTRINVKEGDVVKFQCMASSNVKLDMSWKPPCTLTLEYGSVHSVEKKLQNDNDHMSTEYSILNARKTDSGVYTCTVTNKFGSLRSLQIHVQVEEKNLE